MRATGAAICILLLSQGVTSAETLPLGEPSRTKYVTFETATSKLYIAHEAEITIVDTATASVSGRLTGLSAVRDVVIAPNGHGYVTSSQTGAVTVFDAKSLAILGTLPAGRDTNTIVYDPASTRVFALNDDDGTITVIDTARDEVIKTLSLPGGEGLEGAAADGHGELYAAHPAQHELVRINTETAVIDKHYALGDCGDPSAVALDTVNNRAFVSCAKGSLLVLDTQDGAVVTTVPIGKRAQSVIYDARRGRLFSPSADGTLSVIEVGEADKYRLLPSLSTIPYARTAAEDPATGRLYLPAGVTLLVVSP